jgi:DNA-binding response OmpR family regulator
MCDMDRAVAGPSWRLRRRQFVIACPDQELSRNLTEALQTAGALPAVRVTEAEAAVDAIASSRHRIDAAIFDLATVSGDGVEFCRSLRRGGMRTPIILIAACGLADSDAAHYLDAGANEYLTRPLRIAELLARLRAHLRSCEFAEGAVLPLGRYDFVPSEKLLVDVATHRRSRLTLKETAMLRRLYAAGGEWVSAQTLLRDIWDHATILDTQTVATHASRLRRKLGADQLRSLLIGERGAYRLSLD